MNGLPLQLRGVPALREHGVRSAMRGLTGEIILQIPYIATSLFLAATVLASPAHAALLQGPGFITATTSLTACEISTCAGFGLNINEIADNNTGNFNGWAGQTGLLGAIKLDLLGTFDLVSFSLWNDVNLGNEGVRTFRLDFFDDSDQLLSSSGTLSASSLPGAQVYGFTQIGGVSRVDLQVLSASGRIEIREVAFEGQTATSNRIPEPTSLALAGLGLAFALSKRRRTS